MQMPRESSPRHCGDPSNYPSCPDLSRCSHSSLFDLPRRSRNSLQRRRRHCSTIPAPSPSVCTAALAVVQNSVCLVRSLPLLFSFLRSFHRGLLCVAAVQLFRRPVFPCCSFATFSTCISTSCFGPCARPSDVRHLLPSLSFLLSCRGEAALSRSSHAPVC